MGDAGVRYWHSMTADEAASAVELDPVVILPLAAIEQHGPHLPLSTDLDIGTGLIEAAFDNYCSTIHTIHEYGFVDYWAGPHYSGCRIRKS